MKKENILQIFPDFMRERWTKVAEISEKLQEIRFRVNQPIWILMDNREWFLTENGQLTRDIRKAISSDEKDLCVEIINTGSEIKEEDKERIFHKFYQADTTHNKEGNGIGLSIVKRIVELHDGKVDVLSCDGKTCFKVYFPWE